MLILIAENGMSFDLDCQANTTIETVQNYLASRTNIPVSNHMLICGGLRLDPLKTLGHYNLPAEGRQVVLYNRMRLQQDCPPPPLEKMEDIDIALPPSPSSVHAAHPLDDASNPSLKILPSYERQFKYQLQKGHAIHDASQARFEAAKRLLAEIQVQEEALDTARVNMEYYNKVISQQYSEFSKQYSRQYREHSDLLTHLDRDLGRLKACKLHPALRSEGHITLLDCIKEGSVRKWAQDCATSHRQLNAKVLEVKALFAELQQNVQDLFRAPLPADVQALEEKIEQYVPFSVEQASIIQTLSKDVNTVKRIVDDRVSSQYPYQRSQDAALLHGSIRPHDAVSALQPMYEIHDAKLLPRMEHLDREMAKLLEFCRKSKNAMSLCVHTRMQSVAALQSGIRDLRFQLLGYKEAMAHEDEMFQELKLVRRIGLAYKTCLAEVVRRRACMKLYMGQAGQLAEKLARRREAEVARRETFLRTQSQYLPREVIQGMGLFENPSQCVVNIAPFDTHLLDIDVADIDLYAPEYLRGLHSSVTESNVSGTGEDHKGEGRADIDPDAIDEENSDDISGTSRLEVENAWLKSELAAAISILCNLNPDIEIQQAEGDDGLEAKGENLSGISKLASQKTSEALRLKDEHAKLLHNIISAKQAQCVSYEKRIRELEHRLDEQHIQKQKLAGTVSVQQSQTMGRDGVATDSETSVVTGMDKNVGVPEPMDEGISSAAAFDQGSRSPSSSIEHCVVAIEQGSTQTWEGGDETMCDVSVVGSAVDAAMIVSQKDCVNASDDECSKRFTEAVVPDNVDGFSQGPISEKVGMGDSRNTREVQACNCEEKVALAVKDAAALIKEKEEQLVSLQNALSEKTVQCESLEDRLKSALQEVDCVRADLDRDTELLSECQMNCAHLENRLHEAREEARINLCAAERRAAEYTTLRTSSVHLRGLIRRLTTCISSSVGGANRLAGSLRALAISMSSVSDLGEDGIEFQASISVLADRVSTLAQQRDEYLERCNNAELARNHLSKELEEKSELLKSFYAKRKVEKQASKEKICFTRFNVHELAVFIPNADGYYEAINVNCPNYFLSDESIALFLEHPSNAQKYIVGQIVHIDRNVARLPTDSGSPQSGSGTEAPETNTTIADVGTKTRANPYGLAIGTEYYVVTVAMVPDFSRPLNFQS